MSYELIICEKPSAAQKVAEALADKKPKKNVINKVPYYELIHDGKEIYVACAVGHLFSVVEKNKKGWIYPIFDVEWKPSFASKGSEHTKAYYEVLKKLSKDANEFTLACDYDVEGEVIGERVLTFICGKKDARRMKFSTTTKDDLLDAYINVYKHIDKKLAEAGITRHELDWMWGINLSRALTLSIKEAGFGFKVLSSGRVQGPALHMLCEKEKEIAKFKPEPYWELQLLGSIHKNAIEAWHKDDKIFDKKKVDTIYKKVHAEKKGVVDSVEKRRYKHAVPVPFDLTSLQIEASTVLGMSPKLTLDVAQDLYTNSFISYPRTSSQKLPVSINYKKILSKLSKNFVKECNYLLNLKDLKPKEGAKTDAAHPAIYPTGEFSKKITGRNAQLYELIVRRFFSVFGEDAERETVSVNIDVKEEIFIAKGTRTVFKGWHELYEKFLRIEEQTMPDVKKGDIVDISKIELLSKQTTPPKRYTQASIIKELEKRDLGTKATRAAILDNLYERGYIEGTSITVSPLGLKTDGTLEEYCPEILDEKLTRHFEEEMDSIQEGKKGHDNVIDDAKKFLTKALKHFKENELKIGKALGGINREMRDKAAYIGKCPVCKKGDLNIRRGKFGFFIACSRYEEGCSTTFKVPSMGLVKSALKNCDKCGYPIILHIRARRKPEEYCINLDCLSRKIPDSVLKEVRHCPKCGTELVLRRTLRGAFFACPKFPKCRHIEAIEKKEVAKKESIVKSEEPIKKIVKKVVKKVVKKK